MPALSEQDIRILNLMKDPAIGALNERVVAGALLRLNDAVLALSARVVALEQLRARGDGGTT